MVIKRGVGITGGVGALGEALGNWWAVDGDVVVCIRDVNLLLTWGRSSPVGQFWHGDLRGAWRWSVFGMPILAGEEQVRHHRTILPYREVRRRLRTQSGVGGRVGGHQGSSAGFKSHISWWGRCCLPCYRAQNT